MDSMRNLSTSLPNSGRRRLDHPELLTDFKAAALSVTHLYKSAVSVQAKARAVGYQDALDDLLAFLDKENLGLMDGEGWRVRQWATERLDDGGQRQASSDDEGEMAREEEPVVVETRSSSPEVQRKSAVLRAPSELAEDVSPQRRIVSEPPPRLQVQLQVAPASQTPTIPSTDAFTFRSTHSYPTNHDRESSMDMDNSSPTAASTPSTTDTVRVYPNPRPSQRTRHTNHNRQRGGTINLNLGAGAGGKRKMPYPDFFDISGLNFDAQGHDRRDGAGGRGGGGKRGRHV